MVISYGVQAFKLERDCSNCISKFNVADGDLSLLEVFTDAIKQLISGLPCMSICAINRSQNWIAVYYSTF